MRDVYYDNRSKHGFNVKNDVGHSGVNVCDIPDKIDINGMFTMTTVRSAKSKGSQFEMDCEASLQQIYPDCYRTHERGYIQQYDLKTDEYKLVFECKRLKSLSWEQAKKFFEKLSSVAPQGYSPYLLFKSNNQPCLVMSKHHLIGLKVQEFDKIFSVQFIKHESTRIKTSDKLEAKNNGK